MNQVSEKKHWDDFWAASQDLENVYGTDERIVSNLTKFVDLRGLSVLEVGAGTGRDAGAIASLGTDVCALDNSEESLNLMHRVGGRRFEIVCGDALDLPFLPESFDVVLHQGLLEHFKNPGELLDENVRVLKKGGVLLVDVPQKYHYYTLAKHILMAFGRWFAGWETEFTVGALRRLIQERGLSIVGIYGHNMFPPIWYRGLRRMLLGIGVRLPMFRREPRIVVGLRRMFRSVVPKRLYLNTAMVIGCVARKP
ncbi:MAG: class I SAM-dependent methyltransferase [Candidatus Latescibacterota bacterium]|nr:MAG: class I SAM-dependent methyltransferase [Candidatus Latescibacterota bacterium]